MTEMKINQQNDPEFIKMAEKLKACLTDRELMSVLITLLGAADNVAEYILDTERGHYCELPSRTKYGMLHVYQIMNLIRNILKSKDGEEKVKIGGYFPAGEGAWKSEQDFEKRFILMVKLFYKHLKEQGKI